MNMTDSEKILGFIQELWNDFVQTRAHFPYLTKSLIGAKSFESPGFYKRYNNKLVFVFEKPIDQSIINQNNKVAHWINQSVLIRLAAILDGENIIKNKSGIDQTIEGSKQIEILIKLRNKFAHSKGKYNPSCKDNRKLLKEIVDTFKLKDIEYDDYPISIDTVIKPIFDSTIFYIKTKYQTAGV
jgi:hypothetical protein